MSILKAEDGDVSERELLVDDIQRIREVLHISDGAEKLSSDEEGDEESEEEEEDEREKCGESLIGSTSNNSQHEIVSHLSPPNSQIVIPEAVSRAREVKEQSALNTRQEPVSLPVGNDAQQECPDIVLLQQQANNNFLPPSNISSDECTLTELQPVNCQPSTSVFSPSIPIASLSSLNVLNSFTNVSFISDPPTSSVGYNDATWPTEANQYYGQNEVDEQGEEGGLFSESDEDIETRSQIQECLSLNRDYQLAVLDELERIELALAKNREKQLGLHQMRASKDEGRPEPHTLIKFGNPYFRDTAAVGPPDNIDTKLKRQSCQVGGYQSKQKSWNTKEKACLAEGVKMQNLENKLSPVLQKIQKLELKKNKTTIDCQELKALKAESSRIKNIPKEELAYDLEGIDWDRLSSTYVPKRSGFQCRLQWCNFSHPDVNCTPWTKDEDKKLIQLAKNPQNTWVTIAQNLQTKRTPIHCYERYQRSLNKNLLKSKWTPEDDKQLLEVVREIGVGNWPRVASFLEGRQGDQCMHRYTQTLQMVRKGKWTTDEDELLKKGIEKYGTAWNKVSDMVPGRSGPQCRERWVNALDPKIDKGVWTKVQDKKLLDNVEKFGKGNWSKIARAMGNRTDNQCWRRWIVLRKDDFLYYRQNTLRKKKELVSNFTGRRQERPSLEPEDLDIPDVPVVKKQRGRVPLPPEESRERRKLTRKKFREKKRAEKRRAEEEAREKQQVQQNENNENRDVELEGVEDGDKETVEKMTSHRNRIGGGNRTRVQQPHHSVLMNNKRPSKRQRVAEKQDERHTEPVGGQKTVTVSGSLGPFSLLLQAFSIDIPTVLRAIQETSTTSSTTPSSSGTNVTPGDQQREIPQTSSSTPPTSGTNVIPGDQQQIQVSSAAGTPASQQMQTEVSGYSAASQSSVNTEAKVGDDASESQEKQERAKGDESGGGQVIKHTNTEQTVGVQSRSEVNSNDTLNTSRDKSTTVTPTSVAASTTNQAPRRRATAIPPLPPCFTTLRTFKSILQLRPQLQRIAAMLNPTPGCSTVGSQSQQPLSATCPAVSSGSLTNNMSGVTCEPRDESCDSHAASRKDSEAMNKSRDNETTLREDHVVSPEYTRDVQPSTVAEAGKENENIFTDNRLSTTGIRLAEQGISITDDKRGPEQAKAIEATLSSTFSSAQDGGVTDDRFSTSFAPMPKEGFQVPANDKTGPGQSKPSETPTKNSESCPQAGGVSVGNDKHAAAKTIKERDINLPSTSVANNNQVPRAVPGTRSYRNSYEYKMLSSRFSGLFLWPSLLSKIPVKFTSQMGPVFVQRHPPPTQRPALEVTEKTETRKRKNTKPIEASRPKRKHPGLAAVRMATSASSATPAQQMFTVGQGSAIKKKATAAAQPAGDPSGAKEEAFAAYQLVSLSASSTGNRRYNTRASKRKGVPAKRGITVSESSDSSSEDDWFEVYGRQSRQPKKNQTGRTTRQASAGKPTTDRAESTNKVASRPVIVISSDSTNESQPSLQDAQDDTGGLQSGAAANLNLSPKRSSNSTLSPSSSSKRKSSTPKKIRGAHWRAMLPKVPTDESDSY